MKVTITAPFARVQLELSKGEIAQLIHMALDWAEHGANDPSVTVDTMQVPGSELPGLPPMPSEENRGGEAESAGDEEKTEDLSVAKTDDGLDDREGSNPSGSPGGEPAPFTQGSLTTLATAPKAGQAGYWGFLYIRCEKCMETRGYFTKRHMTDHKCGCSHRTPLTSLRKLTVKCYCCGTEIKYRTNLREERFTVACHNCGAPVEVELHSKLKEYVTF